MVGSSIELSQLGLPELNLPKTTSVNDLLAQLNGGPQAKASDPSPEQLRLGKLREQYRLTGQGLHREDYNEAFVHDGRTYLQSSVEINGEQTPFLVELRVFSGSETTGFRTFMAGLPENWMGLFKDRSTRRESELPYELMAEEAVGDAFDPSTHSVTQIENPSYFVRDGERLAFKIAVPSQIVEALEDQSYRTVQKADLSKHITSGTPHLAFAVEIDGGRPIIAQQSSRNGDQVVFEQLMKTPDSAEGNRQVLNLASFKESVEANADEERQVGDQIKTEATHADIVFDMSSSAREKVAQLGEKTSKGTLRIRPIIYLDHLEEHTESRYKGPSYSGAIGGGPAFTMGGNLTKSEGLLPGGFTEGRKSKPKPMDIKIVRNFASLGEMTVALVGTESDVHRHQAGKFRPLAELADIGEQLHRLTGTAV